MKEVGTIGCRIRLSRTWGVYCKGKKTEGLDKGYVLQLLSLSLSLSAIFWARLWFISEIW